MPGGGAVWVKGAVKQSQEKMVQLAKEDLAERLGITPDDIETLSVTPVTWLDADLGYPQYGRKKVHGYVPGFQILLEYSSRVYDYHSGFSRVVYVPEGKGQPPLPTNAI